MQNTLVLNLPRQPLVVVGDIHGEFEALNSLLQQLRADPATAGRKLVFIGDLCDRGPDSISVIRTVRELVDNNEAYMVLGNHEINLLANEAKDGSGWFFDGRMDLDAAHYAPFNRASAFERPAIRQFFAAQPLAIRFPDLRVVHAAWDPDAISELGDIPCGDILEAIHTWDVAVYRAAQDGGLRARYLAEMARWARELEDPHHPPPYLDAVADYESLEQRINPIKRLTSGIEMRSAQPFYSGNRWRYSDRTAWWNDVDDPTPVIIGHYWRMFRQPARQHAARYNLLFEGVPPTSWHGRHQQVFCIDYSVGARWRDRKLRGAVEPTHFRLAAMLWPERQIVFDNGDKCPSTDYLGGCG